MGKSKHTLGPWVAEHGRGPVNGHYGNVASTGVFSRPIRLASVQAEDDDAESAGWVCGIWGKLTREDYFNACLIAAAPELLEALKGVVRVADRETDEFIAARAAIAKAEGR